MIALKKLLSRRHVVIFVYFLSVSHAAGAQDNSKFFESVARLSRSPDWGSFEHDLAFQLSSVVGGHEEHILDALEDGADDREISTLLQLISWSEEDRRLTYWYPVVAGLMTSFNDRGLKASLVQAADILANSRDLKYLPYIQIYSEHQDEDIRRRMKRIEERMLKTAMEDVHIEAQPDRDGVSPATLGQSKPPSSVGLLSSRNSTFSGSKSTTKLPKSGQNSSDAKVRLVVLVIAGGFCVLLIVGIFARKRE